ncbi:MAG: T9SS type A sorting domain-containing protein [Bacteroidetes bacterium]|nr:T9SS type A sorting domain-containing protein [Bacteroidota bacterium]
MKKNLIIGIVLLSLCPNLRAQRWYSMMTNGVYSGIGCFAVDRVNSILYVGGPLTQVDTLQNVWKVAQWHEGVWQRVGPSSVLNPLHSGHVNCLAFIDNVLYEGGGYPSQMTIGYFDGITWQQLGSGVNRASGAEVYSIDSMFGDIYFCGNFVIDSTQVGGDTVNCVTRWDGTHLQPLGTPPHAGVYATWTTGYDARSLYRFNNEIFISGYFTMAGTIPINNSIARWDGANWMTAGTHNYVDAICFLEYNGELYCGGWGGIQKWNGTDWVMFAPTVNSTSPWNWVLAMTVYNNELVVGGGFSSIDGVAANNIAKWDGTSWSTFDSGFYLTTSIGNSGLTGLAVMDGNLFACGTFDMAGHTPAHSIARWGPDSILGVHAVPEQPLSFALYPNPVNDALHIIIQSQQTELFEYDVCDVTGNIVLTGKLSSGIQKVIPVKNLSAGVYCIKVTNGRSFMVKKFLKE